VYFLAADHDVRLGSEAKRRTKGNRVESAMFSYCHCSRSEEGRWEGCMYSLSRFGLPSCRCPGYSGFSVSAAYRGMGIRGLKFAHNDVIEASERELNRLGRGPKAICPSSTMLAILWGSFLQL
jgi:hypothetical protein